MLRTGHRSHPIAPAEAVREERGLNSTPLTSPFHKSRCLLWVARQQRREGGHIVSNPRPSPPLLENAKTRDLQELPPERRVCPSALLAPLRGYLLGTEGVRAVYTFPFVHGLKTKECMKTRSPQDQTSPKRDVRGSLGAVS